MALLVRCPACNLLAMTDTDTLFAAPAFVCRRCEIVISIDGLAAGDPTIAMLLAVWREHQSLPTHESGRPTSGPHQPLLPGKNTLANQS